MHTYMLKEQAVHTLSVSKNINLAQMDDKLLSIFA